MMVCMCVCKNSAENKDRFPDSVHIHNNNSLYIYTLNVLHMYVCIFTYIHTLYFLIEKVLHVELNHDLLKF